MTLEFAKLAPPVSNKRDHIQGPDTVPATLVEFGDYECPYCGQAYPIIKEIQKYLGNNLRFVFRNFPLTQIHPHAQHAAEAAEAAGAQNKFWRCTITYMNINKHWMIRIWRNMQEYWD